MKTKLLSIFTLIGLTYALPREKISPTAAVSGRTVEVVGQENALGECTCDITANSCDAYCCCDKDCGTTVTKYWNSNYDEYCAKNYIGAAYKPKERCMDRNALYGYN